MKGQKTGGRVKGTPNKATAQVKDVARKYGPDAIHKLAALAGLVNGQRSADTDAAKVSALKELLDRAYGKAVQPMANDPDNPLIPDTGGDFAVVFVKSGTKR